MRRFSLAFFIGALLLGIGAWIAVEVVFAIRLPVQPIALSALLMVLGLAALFHGRARAARGPESGDAWLSDRRFTPEGRLSADAQYDIVFGRGVIDLTHLRAPEVDVTVTVDAVFGAAVVRVDPAIGYDVAGSSAFGEVRVPPRAAAADPPPHLHLRINAVFGSCEVIEAASRAPA